MTVIVDYDAGNLRSVERACAEVGMSARISNDPGHLTKANRIIFPGVGAAGSAMSSLRKNRLDDALVAAYVSGVPILGICLGLQISLAHSEENNQKTLNLLPGRVRRFQFNDPALKIPHMGWNEVKIVKPHPVLARVQPADEFYFVHSYYPQPECQEDVYAESVYEQTFCCALGRNNYFATQFHPEKSGRVGLELLACFSKWDGRV